MGTSLLSPNKIVTVSEFSQGKAGKIFSDVNANSSSYIVMKNNNPVAVIVSVEEYNSYQERIEELQAKLASYINNRSGQRLGVAKGAFEVPDDFDEWDIGFGDINYEDIT